MACHGLSRHDSGRRTGERWHAKFPTFYRINSPAAIRRQTRTFSSCQFVGFSRVGQLDEYVPSILRPLMHAVDRFSIAIRLPGSLLAVRLQK
jgi:hypothetical protein